MLLLGPWQRSGGRGAGGKRGGVGAASSNPTLGWPRLDEETELGKNS